MRLTKGAKNMNIGKSEKIIVCGARWFIGRYLVKRLKAENYSVRGVDIFVYFTLSKNAEWRMKIG